MEKITIKNFLIFDDVEMEIKRFNILIGEQASGKSLLAKLVYFFRSISSICVSSLKSERDINDLSKILSKQFSNYFPTKYWNEDKEFEIRYQSGDFLFTITSDLELEFNSRIEFSDMFIEFYNHILSKVYKLQSNLEVEAMKENIDIFEHDTKVSELIDTSIDQLSDSHFFDKAVYIPSSRSFFSTLDKNIWTLTDQNSIDIDPFMSQFGREFEQSKRMYSLFTDRKRDLINGILPDNYKVYNYFNNILKGSYKEIDGKSWVIGEKYKVNLSRASSGQQEVLPLLMVLTTTSLLRNSLRRSTYFIEEPEAHLFPAAQNEMLSLISLFFSEHDTGFFITTHSPYILSAINNSILAYDTINKGKLSKEGYIELSKGAYPISYNDIAAFAMSNGNLKSIKDDDFRMVGSEVIDGVSDIFQEIMNKLLMLDV